MSDALYRLRGGAPLPLPPIAYDDDGNAYTDPFEAGDLARLGFVAAPPKPGDTPSQIALWDAASEAWVMMDRPPEPPLPEARPRTLGRLAFIRLVQDAGSMTDAMLVQARNASAFAALWIKLDMAEGVERDDPLTGQALDALASAGFLPNGRAAVVESWPKA